MEIMSETFAPYRNDKLNALNDRRIHGGHIFTLNADTHIMFEYIPEIAKWAIYPTKLYPHTKVYVDNMHLLIQLHGPETMEPQPMLRDLKDVEFMRMVMNAIDNVFDYPAPACLPNLMKALNISKTM